MAKVVRWTQRAIASLDAQLAYREEFLTDSEFNQLLDRIDDAIEELTRYPERGRPSKKMRTVRRITIGKTLQLFYRIKGKYLHIVYFYSSKQDAQNNPYA